MADQQQWSTETDGFPVLENDFLASNQFENLTYDGIDGKEHRSSLIINLLQSAFSLKPSD